MSVGSHLPIDFAGWGAFLSGFDDIVLVANSEAVDIAALSTRFGTGALYVFFNKVYKVLDAPFAAPSILVARSSEAGANIVYRGEVEEVVRLLRGPGFRGLMNLRAAEREAFSKAEDFAGHPVGFLDLSGHFGNFYSALHVPSSGFALAVWLVEQRLPTRVHLAGFTARRSERWKVFHVHDWTFEQIVQRLLVRSGLLQVVDSDGSAGSLGAIVRRFPEIDAGAVSLIASEILAERIEQTNIAVDGLLSLTAWQRRVDSAVRSLKPKTRKEKLSQTREGGPTGG